MKRSYLQGTKVIDRSSFTKNFGAVAHELTGYQTYTLVQVFSITIFLVNLRRGGIPFLRKNMGKSKLLVGENIPPLLKLTEKLVTHK